MNRERLSKKDGYKKPKLTFTDKLTKDEIEDQLEDYVNVEDMADVIVGTHIRYFTIKDGKKKFRLGGTLINASGLPDYVVLSSKDKTWSVQTKNTEFFRKLKMREIKEEYDELLDEAEKENAKLRKTINGLIGMNKDLKAELRKYTK